MQFFYRLILSAVLTITYSSNFGKPLTGNPVTPFNHDVNRGCDSRLTKIAVEVRRFSSGDYNETKSARDALLRYSKQSPQCRALVIKTLMHHMDQPKLNFEQDASSYYLWREGSQFLGELKATEALDLLISHLHLDNGYHSASQVHQPAITGILKMGPVAVPKLAAALHQNSNPRLRLAAAYCLTSIGGLSAMDALRNVLASETDKCVSRFIDVSLNTFVHKSKSGHIVFSTTAPEADIQRRTQWLAAFQCTD